MTLVYVYNTLYLPPSCGSVEAAISLWCGVLGEEWYSETDQSGIQLYVQYYCVIRMSR